MSLDNVGATGNEPIKPGMITEAAVKKELARREAINADPTQKPEKESALKDYTDEELRALLNDDYRKTLGANFTTFDESTNDDAKLGRMKFSPDVTGLRIDTEIKYQTLLIDELPKLDIERIKKMGNGKAALPVAKDDLDEKLALIDTSAKDVEDTKGKSYSGLPEERAAMKIAVAGFDKGTFEKMIGFSDLTEEEQKELSNKLEKKYNMTLPEVEELLKENFGITLDEEGLKKLEEVNGIDDKMLKKMVRVSEFDDGQKETLKGDLQKAYGMPLPELAKEFGIEFDVEGLKNLGNKDAKTEEEKKTSTEEVKVQLDALNKLLDELPTEADLKAIVKAEKDNMVYLIGNETDNKSKGVVQKFEEARYTEIAAGRDKDPKNKNYPKLCEQLKDAQDSAIKTYIKLRKAELLQDAMVDFRKEVQAMQKKLDASHTELTQMETFDEHAEDRGVDLKIDERNDYRAKVKEVKKTGKASSKAAGKIGSAGKKDKDKTIYSGSPDADVKTKVNDKSTIYDEKIKAENEAKEEKRKAGYNKNFGHVIQYIRDSLAGAEGTKKITREEAKELRKLLDEYTYNYADKLELIADYVKVDDQSGVAIDKKAKTKVSIETDHSQIDPKKLKFILEKVKDMDLKLDTTEQKAEAKEEIKKLLEEYKEPEAEDPKE